jgi:hypothetical protein
MRKKTLVQVILIIFLIILIYLVFKNYYIQDQSITPVKKDNSSISNIELEESNNNLIKDINYTANNNAGDVYVLLADYGETYIENQELMLLTNVNGKISLKNEGNITINSDFANFNTKTFETTFIKNVIVKKKDETITGDELYLILEQEQEEDITQSSENKDENIIRISRNVLYKKPGYSLSADILEIDLITKNIKIYMMDKYNKVIAKSGIK